MNPETPQKQWVDGKGGEGNAIVLQAAEVQTQGLTGGWFVNELSGDVYFDDGVGANSADLVSDGKNWKWLGENSMFGEAASDVIFKNLNTVEIYASSNDGSVARAAFRGEDAKAFMESMGYKQVPTQVIEYEKSIPIRDLMPGAGRISIDAGCRTQITERIGYVPNDFSLSGKEQVGQSVFSKDGMESARILNLTYSQNDNSKVRSFFKGLAKFMIASSGNHDWRDTGGPCVPNAKLVNQLRNNK
jgi:hypothetical protein